MCLCFCGGFWKLRNTNGIAMVFSISSQHSLGYAHFCYQVHCSPGVFSVGMKIFGIFPSLFGN